MMFNDQHDQHNKWVQDLRGNRNLHQGTSCLRNLMTKNDFFLKNNSLELGFLSLISCYLRSVHKLLAMSRSNDDYI